MSRFHVDKSGTYDLNAVCAVTKGGTHNTGTKDSPVNSTLAILHLEGGQTVATVSDYNSVAAAFTTYHSDPAPVAKGESL
jgi:hypothetical protein